MPNELKPIDGATLAALNCYRNKYYADGNDTEQGLVANAINDVLPTLVEFKNGGYRKASDVVSEILYEEQRIHCAYIHNSISLSDEYKTGYLKATSDFLKMLFDIKKKYESEGAE